MADLCHSCALDTYGEDIGDLAGLSTPDDTAARRYPVALCEGCGPIQVDHAGRRVEDADDASAGTQPAGLPRILNKHVHGIPKGAYYIGRGSPLGNPFVIGRDGTRDEVCDKYEVWIDRQTHLLPLIASLEGRDLVCFCFPKRCHGLTVRRRANPGMVCDRP